MTLDHDALQRQMDAAGIAVDLLRDENAALRTEVERLKGVVGNWMLRSDSHRADRDAARNRVAELEAENATGYAITMTPSAAETIHRLRAELAEARAPRAVLDAASRIRSDIREAIDVVYGEVGGKGDTAEDAEATYRAIARDMATVLDWIAAPAPAGAGDEEGQG